MYTHSLFVFIRQFYIGTEKDCAPKFFPRSICRESYGVDGINVTVDRCQGIGSDLHVIIGSEHFEHELIASFSDVTEGNPDFPDGEILIGAEVGIYDDIISVGEGQFEVAIGIDAVFDVILIEHLFDVVINLRFFGGQDRNGAQQENEK